MFSSRSRIQRRTGQNDLPRFEYLQVRMVMVMVLVSTSCQRDVDIDGDGDGLVTYPSNSV